MVLSCLSFPEHEETVALYEKVKRNSPPFFSLKNTVFINLSVQ